MAIALVATVEVVRFVFDLQLVRSLEDDFGVATPPIRPIMLLRRVEAGAHRRRAIVFGLVVRSRIEHGASAIAATPHLHRQILLRNQLRIETTV